MERTSRDHSQAARANPFSPTATASESAFTGDVITIESDSVRQALGYLHEYLTATATDPGMDAETTHPARAGYVIAIVGDSGTGKTHLATRLREHARTAQEPALYAVYLDATPGAFPALYRRFIQEIGPGEIRALVDGYYADIIAESLQESDLTSDVARLLRARLLAPDDVVERLNLMESDLLHQVRQELTRVTDNEFFAIALTLLLRPGFDDTVWAWLTGGPPAQVLVERGITGALDTEVAALDALGILALLYRHQRRRLFLVVDDLDRVLAVANRPVPDVSAAFRRMLESFTSSGAFLVLAGRPDYLRLLGGDARRRISRVITMSGLTPDETCRFIVESQHRAFGEDRLEPFTRAAVQHLVRLTGGTAGTVIQLCGQLYRRATDGATPVTDDLVRDVVREHFAPMSDEVVHAEIQRRLRVGRWGYHRNRLPGADPAAPVDYWVSAGEHGTGCAILLSDSVLESSDVETVTRRVAAVRHAVPDSEVLLVVNGILSDDLGTEVSSVCSTEPVVYHAWSFGDDLGTAIAASMHRLERAADRRMIAAVGDRVDEADRLLHHCVEMLDTRLVDLSSSCAEEFTAIHRRLGELFDAVSWRVSPDTQHGGTDPS